MSSAHGWPRPARRMIPAHASPRRLAAGWAAVATLAVGVVTIAEAPDGGVVERGEQAVQEPAPQRRDRHGEAVAAARDALVAWARFGVSGDLADVAGHFAPHGPQYAQLRGEADARRDAPPGPPGYRLVLDDPTVAALGERTAVVAGTVSAGRPGAPPARLRWAIHLRRDDAGQRWRVWTVVPTAR